MAPLHSVLKRTHMHTGYPPPHTHTHALARLQGTPLLVLANKQDCPGAVGTASVEQALGLEALARWDGVVDLLAMTCTPPPPPTHTHTVAASLM